MISKSVLVVESDHDTRVQIRMILEDAGHFVVSAANGKDAIALLEKISVPTLIILSASLTLMSAQQFALVVKKHAKYVSVPIAQLVANGEEPLDGIQWKITKPVKKEDLINCVKTCI